MEQTARFMEALYADKPHSDWILLWTLPDKRSYWLQEVSDVAETAQTLLPEHPAETVGKDIYFGVGTAPQNFGAHRRCKPQDITGIPGLWADIDLQKEGHQKTNLFHDAEEVWELLDRCGAPPSIVVQTGGGYHVYWLFHEFLTFPTEEERHFGANLVARWNWTLQAHAKRMHRELDSTFDLSRVLRVPGTWNYKRAPAEVTPMWETPIRRYEPEDFAEIIPEDIQVQVQDYKHVHSTNLTLNPDAQPNFDKFQILAEIDPEFQATWQGNRSDMSDTSPSAYDMALATRAAQVGWTDQEIANLIIAKRRKNNEDLKLREDYYERTIRKAKKWVEKERSKEKIEDLTLSSTAGEEDREDWESKREEYCEHLSNLLNIHIQRIVKYTADEPIYRLETARGSIMLGEVRNLISQTYLRRKIAAAAGVYIPKFKSSKWDSIAQALLDATEAVDIGDESTDEGMIRMWLYQYLSEHPPAEGLDEETVLAQSPYEKDGRTYIFGTGLRDWLKRAQNERIAPKTLGAMLRLIDAVPDKEHIRVEDTPTSRSVWMLPAEFS